MSLGLQGELQDSPSYEFKLNNIKLLTPSSIVVDGILSPNEWDDAENVTKWFMDADPENYDGFNYMYIAEDVDNLYLALDLVSDQTGDEIDEWVGFWLNTNNTISDGADPNIAAKTWYDALDKGMESLLIDVENNQVMPFFNPSGWGVNYYPIKSLDHLIAVNGTFNGLLEDIEMQFENKVANMTSEYNGTHNIYRLDIELPLNEYYEVFPDLFIDNTLSVRLEGRFINNDTIDAHYLTIRDNSGNLLLSSADHTKSISTGTSSSFFDITALPGNFTQDGNVLFSLIGVNDIPFKTSFDRIAFYPVIQSTTRLVDGLPWDPYPYSSIDDYNIAWSFGGSENNATSHRMFELKIPKIELEGYTQASDLGILVGGYGTLSSFENTHNWVLANNTNFGMPFEYSDNYHYYSMPMKGWIQPNEPILSPMDPNPSITGDITLNWNTDPNVVNWTVLRYDSEISELNLDDVEIIGTGLTTNQLNNTVTTSGLYWYAVVGIDSLGYAYLSNVESVSVEIPITTPTTTTDTTTPSSSTNSTTSGGSDDSFLPGYTISFAVIALIVTQFYYRKKK